MLHNRRKSLNRQIREKAPREMVRVTETRGMIVIGKMKMDKKKLLYLTIFLTAVLFGCQNIEASEKIPDNLDLISVDDIFSKPTELSNTKKETLRQCLELIKNRPYVEEKKRCEMEQKLAESLEAIKDYGPDAAFAVPVLVWVFQRNDLASDLGRLAILNMGKGAVPYLKDALESRHYVMTIKVKSLLYELDTENKEKYLNELISGCSSINARERLAALLSLNKINEAQGHLVAVCINLLEDEEDEIVYTANTILFDRTQNIKTILEKSVDKVHPVRSARIARILWPASSEKERENLANRLLKMLPETTDDDRNILVSVMVELGISEIPGKTEHIFTVLKNRDFLNTDWRGFIESSGNDMALVSILRQDDPYASLHALLIVALRGQYLPDFNGVLQRSLTSNDTEIVNRALDIICFIFLGFFPDQVTIGNVINAPIRGSSEITCADFYDWDKLLSVIKGDRENFATRTLTSRLSAGYLDKICGINKLTESSIDTVVNAFNDIKDNLNFYFENTSQITLEDQSEAKADFDSLISKGILVSEDSKTWKIKEDTSDIEKEDIRWFNIAILTQIYPQILVKSPTVNEITKIRYQSLINPLANLLGGEELIAAKAGLLLRVWDYKAVDVLKAMCNSDNKMLALRANGILLYFERVKDKKPHLDFVGNALKDPNPKIREVATDMLILSIVPPEHNIPLIIEALALEERNSMRANASLYFAGKTAIPYLEQAIHHENPKVAAKAMGVLARNSGDPAQYVPTLGKAFKDGDREVKIAAAKALEDIGPAAAPAAPYLIPGMGADRELSDRCKWALQYMGEGVTGALIKHGITSEDKKTALISHSLLVRFGVEREKNLQPVIKALIQPDSSLRSVALNELADLRDAAGGAFDQLFKMVKELKGADKETAIWALSEIAPNRKETFDLLMECLDDDDVRIREVACHCLGTLGSKAKDAIPKLENLAKNDTRSVAVLAEEALRLIKKGY